MTAFRVKWITGLACLCAMAAPSLAWQGEKAGGIKRLYVEAFVTKAGSEKLREDVLAELRKLRSLSLVSSESNADEILGGGGEIWVKSYRRDRMFLGRRGRRPQRPKQGV